MRWSAGKREPGLTSKVPLVIWLMRREMPRPWSSVRARDLRMSMSSVPRRRLVWSGGMVGLACIDGLQGEKFHGILGWYRGSIGTHVGAMGGADRKTRTLVTTGGCGTQMP